MEVRDRMGDFEALGARLMAVAFVQPERLRQYLTTRTWPFPVLADPDRVAYRAFGLGSASWRQLLRASVLAKYFWLLLRGRRPQAPKEDVHQLGGDFVLDRTGRVAYAYRSAHPADRPSVNELLAAVRRAERSCESEGPGGPSGLFERTP